MNIKTVSVIILSYNSSTSIIRAIDSVINQTYESIELIISDDGSKDFDGAWIANYIEKNKNRNIKNYDVLISERNNGTVKNLIRAFGYYSGDYHMIIGADDWLYNNNVISKLVNAYKAYHDEPLLICGNAYMCNAQRIPQYRMMNDEDIGILVEGNTEKILNRLRFKCFLLTVATLYRREFLEVVGMPSEDYVYLEDWPTFLQMAKKKVVPVYYPGCVTCHMIGGIANGAKKVNIDQLKTLFKDRQTLFKKEVIPFLDEMSSEERTGFINRHKAEQANYYNKVVFAGITRTELIKELFKNENAREVAWNNVCVEIKKCICKYGEKIRNIGLYLLGVIITYVLVCFSQPFSYENTQIVKTALAFSAELLCVIMISKLIAKCLTILIDDGN
ncbi:MAG: glycosyltransferase [Butyrivibrio sp.]|jgi:glycosyltransferase involved in cell wall biosynthesis|nr:glycosyltransferase [Butyrivibrio sp.]